MDLYLLAGCDDLIIDTSSSFAYVATLLTNIPAERIFDVKRRNKLPPRMRAATTRLMRRFGFYTWAPALVGKLLWQPRLADYERPARQ